MQSPEQYKNLGNEYINKKEYTKAIYYYQQAIAVDPDYTPAWHNIGIVCRNLGLKHEAELIFGEEAVIQSKLNEKSGKEQKIIQSPQAKDSVDLDRIGPFEFEDLCAEIYKRLGYKVNTTPRTGDSGRDLEIYGPEGKAVIECKRYLSGTTVGRPEIQKFHSAAQHFNALKGIFITTGTFSSEAIEYAKNLSPPIELVDGKIFADLALQANYEIIRHNKIQKIFIYPISSIDNIREKFFNYFTKHLVSYPIPIRVIKFQKESIKLEPSYFIKYNIDSQFSTSVGLIHKEFATGNKLIFNGTTGNNIGKEIEDHLVNASIYEYNPASFEKDVSKDRYLIDWHSMNSRIKQHIVKKHTKIVTYYGKNNQRYSKECVPSTNDIFISDSKQIYIPEQEISINSLGSPFHTKIIENDNNLFCRSDLFNCRICSSNLINKKIFLCNSCGAIIHAKSLLDSCSFTCTNCGKTVCRKCTYNGGIFKKYCQFCASIFKKKNKIPEKTNQRTLLLVTIFIFGFISLFINIAIMIFLLIIGIVLFYTTKREGPNDYAII
jgi:restriction system protein